jgi:thiamine-monophosphate kinase
MPMGTDRPGEFELIARYFVPLAAGEPGAFGLSDDAAVIAVEPGHRLVVTTDTIVSGVHFLPSDPPDAIAAKALAVNLSDLAAMGARPRAYTLALAMPSDWDGDKAEAWLEDFSDRLALNQREAGVALIGGDTVASPGPLCITVTALGMVREGAELRRSAAHPGDLVCVSGMIGDAALGLKYIAGELPNLPADLGNTLADRYRFPRARIELGRQLVGIGHGVADVSDGLVADLGHICAASNVSAIIDASRVPLS